MLFTTHPVPSEGLISTSNVLPCTDGAQAQHVHIHAPARLRLPVIPSPVKQPACHKAGMTLSSPSGTLSLPLISLTLQPQAAAEPLNQNRFCRHCQLPGQCAQSTAA